MTTLPMDIIFSCILPKVHAKSLLHFKCVSRSFLTEISSSKFIKLQHLNALSSNDNRLFILQGDSSRIYICDLDSPHSPHSPISIVYCPKRIVASCECYFVGGGLSDLDDPVLMNPSTRTYRQLPPVRVSQNARGHWTQRTALYGMCHCVDEFNDDYKLVSFTDFQKGLKGYFREVRVYSLRTNSWKLVECEPTDDIVISPRHGTPALVQNHLLHMIFLNANKKYSRMMRIGCFDIKAEKWANSVFFPDVLLGDYYSSKTEYQPYLSVLDGKLCYLDPVVGNATCDFWVMKDYGVKESWVKLMSVAIRSDTLSPWRWHGVYHPIASRKGSPHELLCRQGGTSQFFWHNHINKQVTKAEIDIGGPRFKYSLSFICKGSLLNFPDGQQIGALSKEDEKETDDEDMYL